MFLGIVIGIFIGATAAVFLMACLVAGKDSDDNGDVET